MRFSFGGDLAGWHIGYGATATTIDTALTGRQVIALGSVDVTFWSAQTGGTQYTDLQDATGVATSIITTSAGTATYPLGVLPQFFGPDNIPIMWAAPAGGPRLRITAVDAYNFYAGSVGDVTGLQTSYTTLAGRVSSLEATDVTQSASITSITSGVTTLETWRNLPVAELRPTAATTLTSSIWTTILFGAEGTDTDQDNIGGHSTSVNTGRYTARYEGLYLCAGSMTYNAHATGSRHVRWLVNGVVRPGVSNIVQANTSASAAITAQANTMVIYMGVGDYLELQGYQNSGAAIATYAVGEFNPHFTVVYLRPTL